MMCAIAIVSSVAAFSIPFATVIVFALSFVDPRWLPRFRIVMAAALVLSALTLGAITVVSGSPFRSVKVCR